MNSPFFVKRLGIVAFKDDPRLEVSLQALEVWSREQNVELVLHASVRRWVHARRKVLADAAFVRSCDAILSLGGDGTLISASRLCNGRAIPLLGLNHGRLGFLADLSIDDGLVPLTRVVHGEGIVEERTVLEATVFRGRKIVHRDRCLNEFFLRGRRDLAMIEVEVSAEEGFLSDYWADGLLVATPTGSTAYSLAVGGPIVGPGVPCILLTPVAPHSLNVRPLVLSDRAPLLLRPRLKEGALLLSDGREGFPLEPGDYVTITKSERPVYLLHPPGTSFSEALRQKLGWSGAARPVERPCS